MLDIGKPKKGETVVISGRQVQLVPLPVKLRKYTVAVDRIAGSMKNNLFKRRTGFDEAITINGKCLPRQKACPNGIDVILTMGGKLRMLLFVGKLPFTDCAGQISQYNNEKVEYGPHCLKTGNP